MIFILQRTLRLSFIRIVLLLVLWFGVYLPHQASAQNFSTVVIDPGHGGNDNGSKWYGVSEKKPHP